MDPDSSIAIDDTPPKEISGRVVVMLVETRFRGLAETWKIH